MLEMNRGTQVKDIGSMRKDMKTDLNFRQRSTCYLELVIKLLHNICNNQIRLSQFLLWLWFNEYEIMRSI